MIQLEDILISYGFEDELNTFVTFLSCWFTRPKKAFIHDENSRKLNLLNISPDFFLSFLGLPKHANF